MNRQGIFALLLELLIDQKSVLNLRAHHPNRETFYRSSFGSKACSSGLTLINPAQILASVILYKSYRP